MLYRSWDRFAEASEALARTSQPHIRSCLRWRHEAGLLVIRVTNNHQTLTFKARSVVFLNRFEILNRSLLALHQNRRRRTVAYTAAASQGTPAAPLEQPAPEPAEDVGAGAGAKGKKKKGKKKAGK
ncbi:hypothetical protein JCM6882_004884 [Rhodosporidiobolus microsporus]